LQHDLVHLLGSAEHSKIAPEAVDKIQHFVLSNWKTLRRYGLQNHSGHQAVRTMAHRSAPQVVPAMFGRRASGKLIGTRA